MRVAVSRRIPPFQGIDTYIQMLVYGLEKYKGILDVFLYEDLKNNDIVFEKSIYMKINKGIRNLYRDQVDLPIYLKNHNIDIFHCTENYGMPIMLPCKSILTVHDIIPIVCNTMTKGQTYRFAKQVGYAIAHSKKIITVSEHSRQDIIRYFNVPEKKVIVTYLGYDKNFQVCWEQDKIESIKRKFEIIKPFILIIGGANPRKNASRMIEIFESKFRNQYQLVVVGEKWEGKDFSYKGIEKEIIFTNFITQADLILLYNAADLFVYPSLYEGFGLPILEAMACGTPVITSNTSSMPEVVGDAGIMIDPHDSDSIARAMDMVLSDNYLKKEFIEKGLEHVKLFDIDTTVQQTVEIYKSL